MEEKMNAAAPEETAELLDEELEDVTGGADLPPMMEKKKQELIGKAHESLDRIIARKKKS